ncbi:type I-B CRISPR-associated protein Cas7/Cst2/DevR [Chitinophaga qingshengii]|uniref:Type I-B CRISPR-associated protein Cas7/Cst2/DevR n=1 Tax=Chitinophaga qingshengii TaxID=1569794 RepID=A0ABR7TNX8_9BACT|nr:type I-B CRISPR-associated protein Cas7/Cst2/DevR [Chitinophaga qingshengii]MBC9932179.1 type I-B CRISPR-associated protein Cas7/Cst2/DevR [Chitinophaga qingshengii]
MKNLNNITGALLIDATAAFLNGAGLSSGEDKNKVIPKTFKERIDGRNEKTPYVSAQAWRRWLRDTANEENGWTPSELRGIKESEKGSTSKIATELNPIDFPEDDLFGYMRSGKGKEETIQRTSPFKTSVLKGLRDLSATSVDEAFVHLKDGTPLPYSTEFYATHLEGFFNLEFSRLGIYDNIGSRKELSSSLVEKYKSSLKESSLYDKFKRYELKDAALTRNTRAAGLLKGLGYLRGGAKQAAFGADVSPKILILAGMASANPVFNNIFGSQGGRPAINLETLRQIVRDYRHKLATPVYIGMRTGYLHREAEEATKLLGDGFVIDSPLEIVHQFTLNHLQ